MILFYRFLFLGSLLLYCFSGSGAHYRSITSGLWSHPDNWQSSLNGVDWVNAITIPDCFSESIRISANTRIVYDQVYCLDELLVEQGAVLSSVSGGSVYWDIRNGVGTDLTVEGMLEDHTPLASQWASGSRWQLGEFASILRSRSTAAASWRDHYLNGIAQIPEHSNWILYRNSSDHPAFTTASMYYGNLLFVNATNTFWDATAASSRFSGWTSQAPLIKGNLKIGDSSNSSGIKLYVETPAEIRVEGNMHLGPASELLLNKHTSGGAKGIRVKKHMYLSGTISYSAEGADDTNRSILLTGGNNQLYCYRDQAWWNFFIQNSSAILQGFVSCDHKHILENARLNISGGRITLTKGDSDALNFLNESSFVDEDPLHAQHFFWQTLNPGLYRIHYSRAASTTHSVCIAEKLSEELLELSIHSFGTNVANESTVPELTSLSGDPGNYWADRYWKVAVSDLASIRLHLSPMLDETPIGSPQMFRQESGVWNYFSGEISEVGAFWYSIRYDYSLEFEYENIVKHPANENRSSSYYCVDVLGNNISERDIGNTCFYFRIYADGSIEKCMVLY